MPLSQIKPESLGLGNDIPPPGYNIGMTVNVPETFWGNDVKTAKIVGREWGPSNIRLRVSYNNWIYWIVKVGSDVTTCSPKVIGQDEIK